MTKQPPTSPHPAVPATRKRRHSLLSFLLLVLSLPAMFVGLVVSVTQGYTLGPVLNWRQGRAVVFGALVASLPALLGAWQGLRARNHEQRGGTVGLVLNVLVLLAIWGMVVVALFM